MPTRMRPTGKFVAAMVDEIAKDAQWGGWAKENLRNAAS
jgi:hypothetical protein